MRCLALNASFEPLTMVPVRRALRLIIDGKAEIVETDGGGLVLKRYGHLYKGARLQAATVLEAHGFGVETRGDLAGGRLRNIPAPALRDVLAMIGRLVGYTRQLDVLMRDEGTVEEFTRGFCEGEPA